MVRPKGLGMPARRKRKVPEPQEECEVMDNSEDEDRLYPRVPLGPKVVG